MNVDLAVGLFVAMGQTLMNIIFDDYESDDEDENVALVNVIGRQEVVRIEGYVEIVLNQLSDTQFQAHFRISREVFTSLLRILGPLVRQEDSIGRPAIDPQQQLLSVLWLLATPDSYRSVGERFNMGKSSVYVCFERVVAALNRIAPQIITWPKDDKIPAIKAAFERMGHIPNVIGAVDGTFVTIKAPKEDPEVWVTRKCTHAMTLQAISDSALRFTDVFVGYPGSVSDTRIFRNSDIYNEILRNRENYINPGDIIVADCAYPVLDWCIPPYINRGNLTEAQRNFNHRLSQTRQTIERSFAVLFGRYRRLKFLDMNRMDLVPATILACCVMHNLCLDYDDRLLQEYEDEGQEFLGEANLQERGGLENDRLIFQHDVRGEERRNEICRQLHQL